MPLILLEGADGSGKSTLADAILQRWGTGRVRTWHAGPPGDTPQRDLYERPLFKVGYGPDRDELVICDRWHTGELVYGPLLRGGSLLSTAQHHYLDDVLTTLGAVQVFVHLGDDRVRRARLQDRGDELVSIDQALRAADGYRRLRPKLRTLHLEGTSNVATLARVVLSAAITEASKANVLWPLHLGGYTGPLDICNLLLVGDQRNGGDLPAPFPPFNNSGCSTWFREVLSEHFSQTAYGVVNANEPDRIDLAGLHKALCAYRHEPRVVALGREASDTLSDAGIKHGTVPHPQWWKRFRHHEQPEYAHLIRKAATTREDLIRA